MFRNFKLKSPIATKEVVISHRSKNDLYYVNIIAYGNWVTMQFFTLKDCFNYIREYFNLKKGKENGSKM